MDAVTTLADELLDVYLDARPVSASILGIRDRDDRLPDFSEAGDAAFRAGAAAVGARARAVDPADLTPDDRVTRAVVIEQADALCDEVDVRAVEYAVTDTWTCAGADLLITTPMVGLTDADQADGYLARLAAMPTAFAQLAERHRAGIAAGRVPVRHLVEATVAFLDRYLAHRDSDPLLRPTPPDGSGPTGSGSAGSGLAGFCAARDRVLDDAVRPAVARYRQVLADEVLPHGRPADRAGLCRLPDGDRMYALLARTHTTTDRTPEELHRTGLEQVARLADEYREIGSRVFGTRDLAVIFERLRTDPALRWNSAEELLASARAAIGRAEAAAPRWFGVRPSQSCVVEPVPADEAPGAAAAYYLIPALDGSRPGTYFANTHKAPERDRYASESTAFHEAVPGHHFQLTIALELSGLPLLRRVASFNAYVEGWGLYSERLAEEMGLYSDDVARLGMLAGDSMRACRLVVDTGLHALGWSRGRVVGYMTENSVLPPVEIEQETDRYIADPGQALSYMVGRLEIQRIRAAAERALGDRFDIRAFHDTVLGQGALPMTVLDDVVREWTANRATSG